ncbi:MAG TPA: rod shape-determining protein MreC [Clostridia bacterium]|nr:rod shape-determining protein MreC [Clostridia bacterium]
MKRRGPRIIIIVVVTVALLATFILTALPGTTRSRIGDYFGRVFDPITSIFQGGVDAVGGYFSAVSENRALQVRLEELEKENVDLRLQITRDKDKVEAFEELKDAIHLITHFENTTITSAAVLNREFGPSFDLFRIRAGRRDGISVSGNQTCPVIDQNIALIGRVHSTEVSSSKVMSILHEAFSVSARVEGTYRSSFRVRGDLELRAKGFCIADNIAEGVPVNIGDTLITSGEGGVYPEGILIGEVVDVRTDGQGKTITCVVKPAASLEDLRYVFVLLERSDES